MVATAASYFKVIVEPTVSEFMECHYNIRRGLLAALVLNQMADYVALDGKPRMKMSDSHELVEEVCKQITSFCPEFKFIREIANVTKHSTLSLKKNSAEEVTSIKQIAVTPGLFQAPFGQGRFREACVVYAELADGTSIPLHLATQRVLDAWKMHFL